MWLLLGSSCCQLKKPNGGKGHPQICGSATIICCWISKAFFYQLYIPFVFLNKFWLPSYYLKLKFNVAKYNFDSSTSKSMQKRLLWPCLVVHEYIQPGSIYCGIWSVVTDFGRSVQFKLPLQTFGRHKLPISMTGKHSGEAKNYSQQPPSLNVKSHISVQKDRSDV